MDPLVSLCPVGVEVELGGWVYDIDPLPAIDWISAVLDPSGMAIVPGLADEEMYRDVVLGMANKTIAPEEVAEAAQDALGAVAGRPWWVADRLIRSATHPEVWTIVHGRLKLAGFNVQVESIGAFCDAVYALCIENMSEEQRNRLDFELSTPPAGVEPEQAMEGAADDFMAAMRLERATLEREDQ